MVAVVLKRVLDLLMGGPVRAARKPLPEFLTLPVLFANGRDDDGPALKAFWENQPFMFRGRVYRPSQSPKVLPLERVCLSAHSVVVRRGGRVVDVLGLFRATGCLGDRVLYVETSPVRRVIYGARISFGCEVQP